MLYPRLLPSCESVLDGATGLVGDDELLRQALVDDECCRHAVSAPPDEQLVSLLRQLGLDHLLDANDAGLDTVQAWDATLSVGEQQRIAFARLLTHRYGRDVLQREGERLRQRE